MPKPTRTTSEKRRRFSSGGGCLAARLIEFHSPLLSFSLSLLKNVRQYDAKLCKLLDTYDKAFLVHADNVGSRQFMDIRRVRTILFRVFFDNDRRSNWRGVSFLRRLSSLLRIECLRFRRVIALDAPLRSRARKIGKKAKAERLKGEHHLKRALFSFFLTSPPLSPNPNQPQKKKKKKKRACARTRPSSWARTPS